MYCPKGSVNRCPATGTLSSSHHVDAEVTRRIVTWSSARFDIDYAQLTGYGAAMTDMTEEDQRALKERLRLRWLPFDYGFDPAHADDYDRFLGLPVAEQTELARKMNKKDAALYIVLSNARAHYKNPA